MKEVPHMSDEKLSEANKDKEGYDEIDEDDDDEDDDVYDDDDDDDNDGEWDEED